MLLFYWRLRLNSHRHSVKACKSACGDWASANPSSHKRQLKDLATQGMLQNRATDSHRFATWTHNKLCMPCVPRSISKQLLTASTEHHLEGWTLGHILLLHTPRTQNEVCENSRTQISSFASVSFEMEAQRQQWFHTIHTQTLRATRCSPGGAASALWHRQTITEQAQLYFSSYTHGGIPTREHTGGYLRDSTVLEHKVKSCLAPTVTGALWSPRDGCWLQQQLAGTGTECHLSPTRLLPARWPSWTVTRFPFHFQRKGNEPLTTRGPEVVKHNLQLAIFGTALMTSVTDNTLHFSLWTSWFLLTKCIATHTEQQFFPLLSFVTYMKAYLVCRSILLEQCRTSANPQAAGTAPQAQRWPRAIEQQPFQAWCLTSNMTTLLQMTAKT